MAFTVTIEQFEGPLDLMLHLIKDNKLDLFELDMDVLTDQYLQYLNAMESMHLEVASEYLAELAGLIEYKSKKLLPREKVVIEEEYEEDQREKLVKRLLEYQRYKEVSQEFEKKYDEKAIMALHQTQCACGKCREMDFTDVREEDFVGNPYDLIKAMNRVLRRASLTHPQKANITVKELSLDERILQIRKRLVNWSGKMSFEKLCDDCDSLHMIIVTFLSVLDLIKHKELMFFVDEDEEIWILRGESYA